MFAELGGHERDNLLYVAGLTPTMMSELTTNPPTAREIRAAGPGADAESLREAYLDVLKLALCDLAGARTESVGRTDDRRVFSRELEGEQLQLRIAGMDWPLSGLTMVGLDRLDDLQACVESVVRDGIEGDLIEAGAWRGGASILARATLDSLGADERTVWVADSFEGFPAPDEGFPEDGELDLSAFWFLGARLEEVRGYFARFGLEDGVKFVPGFFEQTLPPLRDERWSIVRLDGDTYEATWLALESLYPGLSAGSYLIVDDYPLIEECKRAVDDFRAEHGIDEPLESVGRIGVRWRLESAPKMSAPPARPRVRREGAARAGERPPEQRVPTARELELERELAELRDRARA
jgi:O-methyltransferase